MASAQTKTITFEDIVQGRDSTVRVTNDGLIYAVDLVVAITDQERHHAAKTLRNLQDDLFSSEKFVDRQLSSRGGYATKLLTFQHAIELVMVLPGKVAKETRTQFANVIRRYMAGDATLVPEIQANAQSASPVAEMARASLPAQDPFELETRKRKLEVEDVAIKRMRIEVKAEEMQLVRDFTSMMATLNPKWMTLDTRLRIRTEDWLKNIVFESGQLSIANGPSSSSSPPPKSICVSDVARQMGKGTLNHGQLSLAGAKMAKAYRELRGQEPPKRVQWVDGCERLVNSYTESDRDLMVAAIHAVC